MWKRARSSSSRRMTIVRSISQDTGWIILSILSSSSISNRTVDVPFEPYGGGLAAANCGARSSVRPLSLPPLAARAAAGFATGGMAFAVYLGNPPLPLVPFCHRIKSGTFSVALEPWLLYNPHLFGLTAIVGRSKFSSSSCFPVKPPCSHFDSSPFFFFNSPCDAILDKKD